MFESKISQIKNYHLGLFAKNTIKKIIITQKNSDSMKQPQSLFFFSLIFCDSNKNLPASLQKPSKNLKILPLKGAPIKKMRFQEAKKHDSLNFFKSPSKNSHDLILPPKKTHTLRFEEIDDKILNFIQDLAFFPNFHCARKCEKEKKFLSNKVFFFMVAVFLIKL